MARDMEPVEIEVDRVVAETNKAIGITPDDGEIVWIPKSEIREGSEVSGKGDSGALVIPRWLAAAKNLI